MNKGEIKENAIKKYFGEKGDISNSLSINELVDYLIEEITKAIIKDIEESNVVVDEIALKELKIKWEVE